MFHSFIERKPWASAVLAFILGPAIGMFYLGKGRKGLVYILLETVMIVPSYLLAHYGLVSFDADVMHGLFAIMLRVIGAPHCYFIARRQDGQRPKAWFARWYGIITILLAPYFLAFVVRAFLFQPFHIPARSMLPNLKVGDHLFVSKFSYGYSQYSLPFSAPIFGGRIFAAMPERGDIAVFRKPKNEEIDFIKRIVGLPGDRIQMIDGVLHINATPVKRERIRERDNSGGTFIEYRETLPNGRNHLIRELSDSAPLDNTPEYTVPDGHVFAMGDNRDNALDSRVMMQVGFVPVENLVGRLVYIYWNSKDRKLKFLSSSR